MTKVLTLNPDGSLQEVVITSGGGGGSLGEINCGTSETESAPTIIDCGGAS